MDNLTHTLIGIGLARAGLAQRLGRGTTLILVVSSNLPDVDVTCLAGGPLAFLWRRTWTHGVLGAVLLAVVASVLFRRLYPHLSRRTVFALTLLGIAGHVFADLWNAYGVALYWPFMPLRVDLDWVFIVDLAIWGILGGTLITAWLMRRHEVWIWRGGLIVLAGYVALCLGASRKSESLLHAQLVADGVSAAAEFVYPEPFGPTRFRGVARAGNDYMVYEIWPFQNRLQLRERLRVEEQTPIVAAARRTLAGRRLDWFFSTAVWRAAPDGQAAVVYGLGFRTELLPNRAPFVFRITPDGQIARTHMPPP